MTYNSTSPLSGAIRRGARMDPKVICYPDGVVTLRAGGAKIGSIYDFDLATAIERGWIQYSDCLSNPDVRQSVENFLFHRQRGRCYSCGVSGPKCLHAPHPGKSCMAVMNSKGDLCECSGKTEPFSKREHLVYP